MWVHCGNASACGSQLGHCWLKFQSKPMTTPAVTALGWSWGKLVPWTAGVLADDDSDAAAAARPSGQRLSSSGDRGTSAALEQAHVALLTNLGRISIRLALAASPNATRWLLRRAAEATRLSATPMSTKPMTSAHGARDGRAGCAGCRFYRAEPVPIGWGEDWFFGPPYALLQGSFGGSGGHPFALRPAAEGGLVLRRGALIMIDKGPDFLIGLAPHPEWATSYTHLGDVVNEDMRAVVEAGIMRQRLKVQNWGSINATTLETPLPFELRLLPAGDAVLAQLDTQR